MLPIELLPFVNHGDANEYPLPAGEAAAADAADDSDLGESDLDVIDMIVEVRRVSRRRKKGHCA